MTDNRVLSTTVNTHISGKNKVLNGDFSIWQRGTTFSSMSDNTKNYTADRWYAIWNGSGSSRTISQQSFSPGDTLGVHNPQYFWRYAVSSAGTGNTYTNFSTKIEDVRTLANQVVTLSAWMKADANRTITPYFNQDYNTGVASTNIAGAPWNLTTSWQRFTFTATLQSLSGKTIAANNSLQIYFDCPANTAFTIDVWGVQVEAGSQATTFMTATGNPSSELAACQRYYYRNTGIAGGATYPVFSSGAYFNSTTLVQCYVAFPVTMRVAPTAIDFSSLQVLDFNGGGYGVSALVDGGGSNTQGSWLNATVSGAAAGRGGFLRGNNSTSAYVGFSAEL